MTTMIVCPVCYAVLIPNKDFVVTHCRCGMRISPTMVRILQKEDIYDRTAKKFYYRQDKCVEQKI
jgi:hypothetical protein